MATRARDWLRQARRNLEHARRDAEDGYCEWGCFSAQQAAGKAVKALYQHPAGEAWGHALKRLFEELPAQVGVTPQLVDAGRILDRSYIPTRYPNGFDDGIPADYYTAEDCRIAIGCAEAILRFCADCLSRQRPRHCGTARRSRPTRGPRCARDGGRLVRLSCAWSSAAQ